MIIIDCLYFKKKLFKIFHHTIYELNLIISDPSHQYNKYNSIHNALLHVYNIYTTQKLYLKFNFNNQ